MKDRIKRIRKQHHLTQTQFGDKIGVKQNTVTAYETGIRTPTDAVILSICREFSVNEKWLREGEGEPFVETTSQTLDKITKRYYKDGNETFRAILDVYANLDEQDQESIEKYIILLSQRIAAGISPVNFDMNVTAFMAGEKGDESPAQDAQGE